MELFCIIFLAVLIPLAIIFKPESIWPAVKQILGSALVLGLIVGLACLIKEAREQSEREAKANRERQAAVHQAEQDEQARRDIAQALASAPPPTNSRSSSLDSKKTFAKSVKQDCLARQRQGAFINCDF